MRMFCWEFLSEEEDAGRETKNSQPANKKIFRIKVVVSSGVEGEDEVEVEEGEDEGVGKARML